MRDDVMRRYPTAFCHYSEAREGKLMGFKVYQRVGLLAVFALSGTFPTEAEAWADAWRCICLRGAA